MYTLSNILNYFLDCKLHGAPEFTLEYGQAFSIPEACLLLKCRGGNNFEVVSG